MSFFLKSFFSHLVGPSEQIDTHDKLFWGCKIKVKLAARPVNILSILKMGGAILSGK